MSFGHVSSGDRREAPVHAGKRTVAAGCWQHGAHGLPAPARVRPVRPAAGRAFSFLEKAAPSILRCCLCVGRRSLPVINSSARHSSARVAARCRRRARRLERRRTFPVRAAAEKTGAPRSRTGNAAPLPAGKRGRGMGQDSARGRRGGACFRQPAGPGRDMPQA